MIPAHAPANAPANDAAHDAAGTYLGFYRLDEAARFAMGDNNG
ncbi:MAG: hypothetical protein JWP63_1456, partial [Candidatus Solibacter sp.]|nr:hypothetical protein [Candidatus Solibacter sp.]